MEERYILEGDLESDGVQLFPGDYARARAGSHHEGLRAVNGCARLIIMRAT